MAERRPSATGGGAQTRHGKQGEDTRQPDRSAAEAKQAELYGSNPPAPGEDQNSRSDMTDIADVAQNQMPGTPQVLEVDPQHRLEEERRHAFDKFVEEHERKERDKKAPRAGKGPERKNKR